MSAYWTNALIIVLLFAFVVDCGLLCLVVMMQRSKQEGLGAAFGGGITESVWGAQTSQVLVKATVWLAAIFFILSIALARLYSYRTGLEKNLSPVQQELLRPAAQVSKPALVPTATPMTNSAATNTPGVPTLSATPVAPTNAPAAATNAAPAPAAK
jgi:preprotein translocase subunit SecG